MKMRWMWLVMTAVFCSCMACEVRNPITSNKQSERAAPTLPAAEAPVVNAPAEVMEVNTAPFKPNVIKPVGINRQQLNLRLQDALRKRGNAAQGVPGTPPGQSPVIPHD